MENETKDSVPSGEMVPTKETQEAVDEIEWLIEFSDRYENEFCTQPNDLCTWYMGKMAEADALEKKLDEQYERMKKEINNRRVGLQYACGPEFRAKIDAMIQAGPRKKDKTLKKKSVNLLTGVAGYRQKKETVKVVDEDACKKWAVENLSFDEMSSFVGSLLVGAMIIKWLLSKRLSVGYINRINTTPLLDYIKRTGEIPDGVELVEAEDTFYPQVKGLELPPEKKEMDETDMKVHLYKLACDMRAGKEPDEQEKESR